MRLGLRPARLRPLCILRPPWRQLPTPFKIFVVVNFGVYPELFFSELNCPSPFTETRFLGKQRELGSQAKFSYHHFCVVCVCERERPGSFYREGTVQEVLLRGS